MAKPYSLDLRERVIARCDAGGRPEEVAPLFRVSVRSVYYWLRLRKETGGLSPRLRCAGPKPKLAEHGQRLRDLVAERPDATLAELCSKLPVKVCIGTLWAALRKLGLSLKKKSFAPPNGCGLTYRTPGHGGGTE